MYDPFSAEKRASISLVSTVVLFLLSTSSMSHCPLARPMAMSAPVTAPQTSPRHIPLPKHPPILRACSSDTPYLGEKAANTACEQWNPSANSSLDLMTSSMDGQTRRRINPCRSMQDWG